MTDPHESTTVDRCSFPSCRCEWSKRQEHCPRYGGTSKGVAMTERAHDNGTNGAARGAGRRPVLYVALAVINTVAAFTAGPVFFGWEVPDGIAGILAGACWVFALETWRDV